MTVFDMVIGALLVLCGAAVGVLAARLEKRIKRGDGLWHSRKNSGAKRR